MKYPIGEHSDPFSAISTRVLRRVGSLLLADPGTYYWTGLAVTNQKGNILFVDPNTQFRATRIAVWGYNIDWHFSQAASSHITNPLGNGVPSDNNFTFPGANQYGIVIYQGSVFKQVAGTTEDNATLMDVDITKSINVDVNDGVYGDNSGAYCIGITVIHS